MDISGRYLLLLHMNELQRWVLTVDAVIVTCGLVDRQASDVYVT